jgi:hypothetical protein
VASVEEIHLLIGDHVARLDKALESDANYEMQKGKEIRQSFGLLALLGQALVESPGPKEGGIDGAALRDAALEFKRNSTSAEAQAALATVHRVLENKSQGEHAPEHPWNKLINMHPMMEELNAQNSRILKVLKRPRGNAEEALPAVTWALLSLAMKADTHEVKNPDDLPKWNAWADDFRHASLKLAEAIRAKDKDEGRKWFDKANETCDACHEVFKKD